MQEIPIKLFKVLPALRIEEDVQIPFWKLSSFQWNNVAIIA
jgi:hypothetical protein